MTKDKKNIVKDFIYLDVDRLYSLYSQIFEGVADKIVQSYIDSLTRTDMQKKGVLGNNLEEKVGESSNRTESKILYDHMYNQLEYKLNDSILEIQNISGDNYQNILAESFMIKITGNAEIEDYNRAKKFTEKLNYLAETIAYAAIVGGDVKNVIDNLNAQISSITDKNEKAKVKNQVSQQLKILKDPKRLAQEIGLSQDEKLLGYLNQFIEMFHPEGYEITIIPNQGTGGVVFRGIIDKHKLRIEPNYLRTLYGGLVKFDWTMVGHVTFIPTHELTASENQLSSGSITSRVSHNNEKPSLRDPYRELFHSMRDFESLFLESQERVEILVHPLAIYREVAMSNIRQNENSIG